METALPLSSAPPFPQCPLGNAVHLCCLPAAWAHSSALRDYKFQKAMRKLRRSLGAVVLTERPRNLREGQEGSETVLPNGQPLGRGPRRYWLRRHGEGGVSGMRRGAVRCSRC
jgi:hypothetical protein